MRIAIASGKGGTGKTFVATNLAAALAPCAFADADVEAANAALFLHPRDVDVRPAETPVPDFTDACTGCGACARACRFGALATLKTGPLVFAELCHSCGTCEAACPENAITRVPHRLGEIRVGSYRAGGGPAAPFVDGRLDTGQIRSSAVIAQVKEAVAEAPIAVLDGPPGSGCAVAEALDGADLVLLVTEPTPFGLADLEKAAALADHLGVPQGVIVNRAGLGGANVEAFCREHGLPIVMEIPFDPAVARLYARGGLAYDEMPAMRECFDALAAAVREGTPALKAPAGPVPVELLDDAAAAGATVRCVERPVPEDLVQVAVLSGKGGTGKTSLAASLADALEAYVAADADVDAANLHLLLRPEAETCEPFSGAMLAVVDSDLCRGCGVCAAACHFGAITLTPRATIDSLRCEGCGLCEQVCPLSGTDEMPLALKPRRSGHACFGDASVGPLARGELEAGGEASGKLVTRVRTLAEAGAGERGGAGVLIDSSPGTGCPVSAALTGCDFAVAVTEPTRSGLSDLARALDLAAWFRVPVAAVINKADLSDEVARDIRVLCGNRRVEVAGEVPFDPALPAALSHGTIPSRGDGPGAAALARVCAALTRRIAEIKKPERRKLS